MNHPHVRVDGGRGGTTVLGAAPIVSKIRVQFRLEIGTGRSQKRQEPPSIVVHDCSLDEVRAAVVKALTELVEFKQKIRSAQQRAS